MRLSTSEKEEIIRLVDRSELGVNKTLRELPRDDLIQDGAGAASNWKEQEADEERGDDLPVAEAARVPCPAAVSLMICSWTQTNRSLRAKPRRTCCWSGATFIGLVFWMNSAVTGGPPSRSWRSPHSTGPMRDWSP